MRRDSVGGSPAACPSSLQDEARTTRLGGKTGGGTFWHDPPSKSRGRTQSMRVAGDNTRGCHWARQLPAQSPVAKAGRAQQRRRAPARTLGARGAGNGVSGVVGEGENGDDGVVTSKAQPGRRWHPLPLSPPRRARKFGGRAVAKFVCNFTTYSITVLTL